MSLLTGKVLKTLLNPLFRPLRSSRLVLQVQKVACVHFVVHMFALQFAPAKVEAKLTFLTNKDKFRSTLVVRIGE